MIGAPSIARLRDSGRIWTVGAQMGDDGALESLAHGLLKRWQRGDALAVSAAGVDEVSQRPGRVLLELIEA